MESVKYMTPTCLSDTEQVKLLYKADLCATSFAISPLKNGVERKWFHCCVLWSATMSTMTTVAEICFQLLFVESWFQARWMVLRMSGPHVLMHVKNKSADHHSAIAEKVKAWITHRVIVNNPRSEFTRSHTMECRNPHSTQLIRPHSRRSKSMWEWSLFMWTHFSSINHRWQRDEYRPTNQHL